MDGYQVFWGDAHHNTYQHYVQDPPLEHILQWASTYLDFYTGAYYTPAYVAAPYRGAPDATSGALEGGHLSETQPATGAWTGVRLEGLKEPRALLREWTEFQEVTASWNRPSSETRSNGVNRAACANCTPGV